MLTEKVIEQLESLKAFCEEFIDEDDENEDDPSTWIKDVKALNIAINKLKKDLVALPSYKN